ncbi:MAG: Type 1 glutamine amidotransferase-like domain-containing protein [Gammaproteobacteria bacterium]|nr:Type 1 glutamine amidotransferase-like domain-containing protein [Gammaproteobacteria bacterium]
MTKYILHGGAAKRVTDDNKKFFREITSSLSDSVIILIVCYAMKEDVWDEVLEADKKTFSAFSRNKNLKLVLADKQASVFLRQIKSADAIYIHVGNTHILKKYFDKVPNLENTWKDKIVAGTSAGALVLGKYFYENDDDTYNEGLGILPFKIICHYDEKSDKLKKLKRFRDNIEIRAIAEEKFITIEQ